MRDEAPLAVLAERIGSGVDSLGFQAEIEHCTVELNSTQLDLALHEDGDDLVFSGQWRDVTIRWRWTPQAGGFVVRLELRGAHPLHCRSVESLRLRYAPPGGAASWRILSDDDDVFASIGAVPVAELGAAGSGGTLLKGAFRDSASPGLLLATPLPQRFLHRYHACLDGDALTLTATTSFPVGMLGQHEIISEETWVCASLPARQAIRTYAGFVPLMQPHPVPPVGWSSWDYYFTAVWLDDIIENMEAVRRDPALAQHVTSILVDEGWEHQPGAWEPNYRFPGGMTRLADEIRSRGFTPAVWLAPVHVHPESPLALRSPQALVKNRHGDPQVVDGRMFMLDPTHPEGQAFLRDVFTRLYDAGFRCFKLDFVLCLLEAEQFHDPTKGHYDALRDMLAHIRAAVTEDSHLLGCGVPAACGPRLVESGRIAVDIHNQWSHVTWIVEQLSVRYWMHNRIWVNDPDYLVVRGRDTSNEAETNVLNPRANDPQAGRWRSGPVFSYDEARTWASIVALSGGSVRLSDRLDMLNERGRALLRHLIVPTGVAAEPLDLCDARHPALWHQSLADQERLTVINWADQARELAVDFARYGLPPPAAVRDWWDGETYRLDAGVLRLRLAAHACMVVSWRDAGCGMRDEGRIPHPASLG
jgi:hypothetical protein